MLRFHRTGEKNLFEWVGIVQHTAVKSLYKSASFTDLDRKNLIPYCYPTDEPMSGPLSYVFRFKASDGNFYNAFCLLDQTSFQLRDLDTNQQCCICMITQYYHFRVFEDILKVIRSLLLHSLSAVDHFLDALRKQPSSITTIPSLTAFFGATITREAHLKDVSQTALSCVPIHSIGLLMTALMTDTSVIVVSSDLSQLSQFCYSLVALISPLQWHHLFMPVLPMMYLESIQSPAPFIAGLHRLLAPKVADCDVEGHILVDIDHKTVTANGLEPFPGWVQQLMASLKTGSPAELKMFMVSLICTALGVQTANSHRTTVKRINAALQAEKLAMTSFAGVLMNSRTMKSLVDAIKEPNIPAEYTRLLAMGNTSLVTSPAIQEIAEFPLKKVAVKKSQSYQFSAAQDKFPPSQSMPTMQSGAQIGETDSSSSHHSIE